jgi:hypothetical protein
LRFAVHRPGNPVASPRSHRMPCGDVSGRIHVSVQRVTASHAAEQGLALATARCDVPAPEQRWLVYAGLTFSTRPGALSLRRRTSRPHPDRMISRFSPAFCRTFRPGSVAVPLADRVMHPILRSSTRITSNRHARLVLVFSHQSLRISASRAFSRARARFTRLRRSDPRLARASRRSSRRKRCCSCPARRGQDGSSRWTGPH